MRRHRSLVACALALLAAAPAHAACDEGHQAWVRVSFSGVHSPAFARAVLADLEAGLSRSDLSLCPLVSDPRSDSAALAAVEPTIESTIEPAIVLAIEGETKDRVAVHVQMRTGGAARLLERNVDLSHVPGDSRAFAVALVADELIRAGWAERELAAEPAPFVTEVAGVGEPRRDPRADRVRASASEPGVGASLPGRVGARAVVERFAGGQTQWGADGTWLVPLGFHLQAHFAPGVRQGFDVAVPHGRISSRALSLATHLRYLLLENPFELATGLGLQGEWLALRGQATDPSTAPGRFDGFVLYSQAVVSTAWHAAGPLWLELGVVLGAPLHALEGTDDGHAATAASGLELGLSTAVSLQL